MLRSLGATLRIALIREEARKGNIESVLSNMKDLHQDDFSVSILENAAESGNVDLMKALIGMFPDKTDFASTLFRAAESGKKEMFELLLGYAGDIDSTNCEGVKRAARNGRTEILRAYAERGAKFPEDALFDAADNGHEEALMFLVEKIAPQTFDSRALTLAVKGRHVECVRILIPLSDIDAAKMSLSWANDDEGLALLDALASRHLLTEKTGAPSARKGHGL